MKTPRPRILAIETDPERGERLQQFLREQADADVTIASSGDAAVHAIRSQVPDIVLTSMLLPPRDEAQVISQLRAIDDAAGPAVLVVPPLREASALPRGRRGMFRLGFGSAAPWPMYDSDAIGARIRDALARSGSGRFGPLRVFRGGRDPGASALVRARVGVSSPFAPARQPDAVPLTRPNVSLIERAHRWTPTELPWACSVQAPPGVEARVINVSRSGILIESGSKLSLDTVTAIHLSGPGSPLVMPARVVRSEVATVDIAGVKYRIAAAFNGRLDPVPEGSVAPGTARIAPRTLTELLARVATEVNRGQGIADVKSLFEQGVRKLASAHDVSIRETPAPTSDRESIYFQVPSRSGSRAVLQVDFEPGHRPAAEDLILLKAAAVAAGLVLNDDGARR